MPRRPTCTAMTSADRAHRRVAPDCGATIVGSTPRSVRSTTGGANGAARVERHRGGGLGRSKPAVVRWLGDIRRYFPTPVVQILQRDAVDRLDLRQLLLEPELLRSRRTGHPSGDVARRTQPHAARRDPCHRPRGDRTGPGRCRRPASPIRPVRRCGGRSLVRPGHADRGPGDIDWPTHDRGEPAQLGARAPGDGPRTARRSRTSPTEPRPRRRSSPSTSPARWPTASSTHRCSPACSRSCRRCGRGSSCSTPRSPI